MNSSSTFSLFFLLLLLLPLAASQPITNNFSSLDALIQTVAFHPPQRHRSNRPHRLRLPSNLSSATATALRTRGANLWLRRTNLGFFRLPPGTITAPFLRRTLLVSYDLGNLSSSFFSLPGYVLVAPVAACLAYDASNATFVAGAGEVGLRPTRGPITIAFPPADGLPAPARCVRFGPGGPAWLGGVAAGEGMRCEVREAGHFSVVVEAPAPVEGEGRGWSAWVWAWVGIGCGVVGAVGFGVRRARRKRRMEAMRRSGEEGEALGSVWVGGSKLPVAPVARTTPAIESEGGARE